MNINVQEDPTVQDITVSIICPRIDDRIRRIIAAAEVSEMKLAGMSEGFLCMVDLADVLYIESVDRSTFIYKADKVVESNSPLSELEEELSDTELVRATRQMLVNLAHVNGIRPYLNARLELVLDNGEHIIASRQFAPTIKERIGL